MRNRWCYSVAAIADSQLIWIEESGHVPHFDQPQVVANHLLSFMQHVEH
ncbi:MAG TPA: alpha/beta hydrolase [Leptolyngbyaceae cyanobacterium M33_DOE_097]|uniref:Alpha/beta hydrolase n=1 Tax=Oscillatoriales cyanobacterium SpSt-418 TaxID=2282169 RepID=A0A7C3KDB1_9CYAN|nr:alpha/beta hydrolase [Leptolyngbyaceae cyanobacterium M33_DOE_097]